MKQNVRLPIASCNVLLVSVEKYKNMEKRIYKLESVIKIIKITRKNEKIESFMDIIP